MKLIKWELRVFVWLVGFLLFLFIIMEFPDYNFKRKDKGLHIPFTSYDIENEKESTIQMILEDCGFENIVVDYVQTDSADKNGYIKLTEGGIILAKHIYDRNVLIARHFTGLGVDEKTAQEDARMIERFISDTTFNAIRDHQIKNGTE